jgi:hypothetical protein
MPARPVARITKKARKSAVFAAKIGDQAGWPRLPRPADFAGR